MRRSNNRARSNSKVSIRHKSAPRSRRRAPKDGTQGSCCKAFGKPSQSAPRKSDGDSFDPEGVLRASASKRAFRVVLIKPSHYDADGYVIQWWRSMIPSKSPASVFGLLNPCAGGKGVGAHAGLAT